MTCFRALVFVSLTTIFASGCDYVVEKAPFSEHESHDIKFEYPVYWDVSTTQITESYNLITISSPLGAAIVLAIVPVEGAIPLEEYSRIYSDGIKENTRVFEISDTTFTPIEGQIGDSFLTGIREEYSAKPLGISVPMRIDYFSLHREKDVVYIIVQADDDIKLVASEVKRIRKSLVFK